MLALFCHQMVPKPKAERVKALRHREILNIFGRKKMKAVHLNFVQKFQQKFG